MLLQCVFKASSVLQLEEPAGLRPVAHRGIDSVVVDVESRCVVCVFLQESRRVNLRGARPADDKEEAEDK